MTLLKHFGYRLRGLALSGRALQTFKPYDPAYIIAVFKGIEKISFYSRGEYTLYFRNKIRSTEAFRDFVRNNALEPPIYVLPVDVKELKYGIPFLVHLILNSFVLYDPDGEIRRAIDLFKSKLDKTDYGFTMKITALGEVKEV